MTPGERGGFSPIPGSVSDLGERVGTYPTYAKAQRAVDFLSDRKFPVEHTAIVGTDLSLVEKVLGRMTVGRAAASGLASGAWFGLLIGLILSLFSSRHWWAILLAGLGFGALWGAVFGALAHSATRGMRDFVSRSSITAGSYTVLVSPDYANQARQQLLGLTD